MKKLARRKLSKRVTREALAPAPRVKIKMKPRGRSFERGNGFGSATRYKPGQSGNPDGRPQCKEISKALRERLESDKPIPARTYAERLAKEWVEQGLGGNVSAIVSLADRTEGRPAVCVSLNEGPGPIEVLIASMEKYHAEHYGPPEGHIAPQLDDGEDDDEREEEETPQISQGNA
jgi:hypothetical protein